MESIRDVIYEAWFFRLSGSISVKEKNGKRLFKSKGSWREKYFILVKLGDKLFLEWYDKKPANTNVQPKDRLSLWPSYRLTKCHADRYVCSVSTPSEQVHVGATDQSSIDTFAFNLQTQTVLRETLEGTSFTVLPDNSLDQDRLGAVGSVCVLHVSPWGISLALQQSRSLIAHWPLKCVRSYESDSKGHFTLESGKRSPFGEGTYVFQTRRGQDDELYNILEHYVMQAASLADNYPAEPADEEETEYNHLKRLTIVQPRPRETVRASMYCSGLYDHILQDYGEFSDNRDSVATTVPDIVSHSAHVDQRNRQTDAVIGPSSTAPRDSTKSNLMSFGDYPELVSPTEPRQVMIKPRTLIDKSIIVSQELPKPLSLTDDLNQYEEPDDDLKAKKEKQQRIKPLPPSIPPPGPFSKPPPPKRSDSRNQLDYEDPKVQPVEYEEPGFPRGPPPPIPTEMADIPRLPPPPIPPDIDIPRMPPPPVPKEPMTTFSPRSHMPLVRENTYVDESEMNPYDDPDMPLQPPPPPPVSVSVRPPPVPPFPPTLAVDDNKLNEYAEMCASVPDVMDSSVFNKSLNQRSKFEDPYADAQDLDVIRRLAASSRPNDSVEYLGPNDSDEYLGMDSLGARPPVPSMSNNNSVEYLGPNDIDEYLGMDSLGNNVSQIQLRRSPDPTKMNTSESGDGEEYLKMSDIRKSAPLTGSGGEISRPGYSKSHSMYEIERCPHIVDIDIDGPGVPEVWVTPVQGQKGKDVNRNTIGSDHFKTWSHRSRLPDPKPDDDDDDVGYLLLPPKLSRTRLQSQSCEELSERQRQSQIQEPNEEGYFEINDDGVVSDLPMPFTGLLDMKHMKKGEQSPQGNQENMQGKGGLNVPSLTRFQRSVSNPDVAGKGRKTSHGKKESEESSQKHHSKFSAFLYGTMRKKKSKSKINTDGDASPGTTPRSKPMKATPPQDKLLKPDYKSPKEKSDKHEKHKRKLSGPAGGHTDIVGGIEIITPRAKSFVKVKPLAGKSSPQRGTSYPNQPTIRTPSPNMGGRRLPSLPTEFADRDRLNAPRANIKHAQSQPNLL